jgi:hypothetical protein
MQTLPTPEPAATTAPISPTATPSPPTPTPTSPGGDLIYVSFSSGGSIGGIDFKDEDILAYDVGTGTWSMYFDGSAVGASTDINAFDPLPDGSILISFNASTPIDGFGTVAESDIVRFIPASTGNGPAGRFEWFLDGSDVGLDGANIDAIGLGPDGRPVVSTAASVQVGGVEIRDEDLIVFTAGQLGEVTSGTWAMYFDGSDVGLTQDTTGVWIDSTTGKIYLTVGDAFTVDGISGDSVDILACTPSSLGEDTACTFDPGLYWDGSVNGLAEEKLDGLSIVLGKASLSPIATPGPTLTLTVTPVPLTATALAETPVSTVTTLLTDTPLPPTTSPTPVPPTTPPTLLPTARPTLVPPAATPTPPPLCTVLTTAVNLRYGPGVVYTPPIRALPNGANLEPLARSPDGGWIQVRVQETDDAGWVSIDPQYVSCNVELDTLPLGTVPPTPTPAP